ncbi:MAG TPA: hypothetical protein VGN37_02445 [Actinocatenispora sp.]
MTPRWRAAVRRAVPLPVRRLVGFEAKGTASIALWLTGRRHGVPPGAVAVGYSKAQTALQVTFLVLSVAELVAMELLLRTFGAPSGVRVPLLVVDAYGVVIGLAVVAGCVTRPHVVSAEEVRVRYGAFFDLRVPRARVVAVRRVRNLNEHGTVRVADGTLVVAVAAQTNIALELAAPVPVVRPLGRRAEATRIRFWADDPDAALAALRGNGVQVAVS